MADRAANPGGREGAPLIYPDIALAWGEMLLRIAAATVIGAVIGVEREYKNRPAGMRTHVLVCLGACIIALIECSIRDQILEMEEARAITFAMGRICAQVVSGIGFLGAGTIFTAQKKIAGLTTAASLWNAACLGMAAGLGFYAIALVGCACVMLVLFAMQKLVRVNAVKKVEVKFVNRGETISFISGYLEGEGVAVMDLDFHVDNKGGENLYTNTYTLKLPGHMSYAEIINQLSEYANVLSVRTTNT